MASVDKYYKLINHQKMLYLACKSGNINIAKWIVEDASKQDQSISHEWSNDIGCQKINVFEIACHSGHTEIVKWLSSIYDISHCLKQRSFSVACMNGYIDIAKHLIDISPDKKININCGSRCVEELNRHNVDIIYMTIFDHYNITEWLMQLSLDESYGKYDLREQMHALRNYMDAPIDNRNLEVYEKNKIIYLRMHELRLKYYDQDDVDDVLSDDLHNDIHSSDSDCSFVTRSHSSDSDCSSSSSSSSDSDCSSSSY